MDVGDRTLRCAVLGAGGVGKSATVVRYTQNAFLAEYDPTIENAVENRVQEVDGVRYRLDIRDPIGQEEFSAMRDQDIRDSVCFLVLYSLTDRQSFDEAARILDRIMQIKDYHDEAIVLCGNKLDLVQADPSARVVTRQEGENLARTVYIRGHVPFFETSAKTPTNIDEAFATAIRAWQRLNEEQNRPRSHKPKMLCSFM